MGERLYIQAEMYMVTYMRTADVYLCMVVMVVGAVAGVLSLTL